MITENKKNRAFDPKNSNGIQTEAIKKVTHNMYIRNIFNLKTDD